MPAAITLIFNDDASRYIAGLWEALARAGLSSSQPALGYRPHLTLLPAFGEFTGGAPIQREAGDAVVVVADDRLFRLPVSR